MWSVLFLGILGIFLETDARRNYEVEIEGIDFVRDPGYVMQVDILRVEKFNHTTMVVNMVANLTEDMPMDTLLQFTAYQKLRSNKFSMIPVRLLTGRLCDIIKMDPIFYPPLRNFSNFPSACPITKGDYWITNFVPDLETMPDEMPGERWRCDQVYTSPSKGRTLFKMSAHMFFDRI